MVITRYISRPVNEERKYGKKRNVLIRRTGCFGFYFSYRLPCDYRHFVRFIQGGFGFIDRFQSRSIDGWVSIKFVVSMVFSGDLDANIVQVDLLNSQRPCRGPLPEDVPGIVDYADIDMLGTTVENLPVGRRVLEEGILPQRLRVVARHLPLLPIQISGKLLLILVGGLLVRPVHVVVKVGRQVVEPVSQTIKITKVSLNVMHM